MRKNIASMILAAVVAAGLSVAMGRYPTQRKVLRAQRVELIDSAGKVVAVVGVLDAAYMRGLLGRFQVDPDDLPETEIPALMLLDAKRRLRAFLSLNEFGEASLNLYGPNFDQDCKPEAWASLDRTWLRFSRPDGGCVLAGFSLAYGGEGRETVLHAGFSASRNNLSADLSAEGLCVTGMLTPEQHHPGENPVDVIRRAYIGGVELGLSDGATPYAQLLGPGQRVLWSAR